jgi:hypothetical protein
VQSGSINPIDVQSVESTTVLSAEQIAKPPVAAAKAAAGNAASSARAQPMREAEQRAAENVERARAERDAAEPQFAEPDEEVVPPATADSPQVREAWLKRIRELVHDGHVEQARESLHAFRARYPGVVVPEDLRALGE